MNETPGTVRRIAWGELFPWLILLRVFRIAISPTLLALATLGVLIGPLGWRVMGPVFFRADGWRALRATGEVVPRAENSVLLARVPAAARPYLPAPMTGLEGYVDLAEPLARFFRLQLTLREAVYYLLGWLWMLAVWTLPGAAITRRAVVQLASDAPDGGLGAIRFAARRWLWYFLAPLYPLVGVLLLTVPVALVGLLLRVSLGLGAVVAGLLWLVVLVLGLGAMWLLVGLLFGGPLMWPAISAEPEGDSFEAFSRSYSYVYGKPLKYFFYVVVAAALGALGWAVVEVAMVVVQEFGFWALSWGAGREAAERVREQALDVARGEYDWRLPGLAWRTGTGLIGGCLVLLHAVAGAFRFTYFFVAASAIYLLLRQDVDEKPLDEVYTG